MMKGLRRLARAGFLLREVRGIRTELAALREVIQALAERTAPGPSTARSPESVTPEDPLVEVSYVDTQAQAAWMEIELRLTRAKGQPPSEDEILLEWERMRETATGVSPERQ